MNWPKGREQEMRTIKCGECGVIVRRRGQNIKHCVRCRANIVRRGRFQARYGIDEEEFNRILEEQNGHCAICPSTYLLGVDHDHTTGVVRGILCRKCNSGIGFLQDSIDVLHRAVAYLEKRSES